MTFEYEIWDWRRDEMIFDSDNEQEVYDVVELLLENSLDLPLDNLALYVYTVVNGERADDEVYIGPIRLDQWLSETEVHLGL